MKAKEYFDKYEADILYKTTYTEAIRQMFVEMTGEYEAISKSRHIKTDRAAVAIIKELNAKWNAVCSLWEKRHGISPMAPNAILNYYVEKIPAIGKFLRGK